MVILELQNHDQPKNNCCFNLICVINAIDCFKLIVSIVYKLHAYTVISNFKMLLLHVLQSKMVQKHMFGATFIHQSG